MHSAPLRCLQVGTLALSVSVSTWLPQGTPKGYQMRGPQMASFGDLLLSSGWLITINISVHVCLGCTFWVPPNLEYVSALRAVRYREESLQPNCSKGGNGRVLEVCRGSGAKKKVQTGKAWAVLGVSWQGPAPTAKQRNRTCFSHPSQSLQSSCECLLDL